MTHNKFWWNCKHIEVDNNLGVAFCTKNNDFCNKSKCTEIQANPKKQYYRERMEELQKENEQLKQDIEYLEEKIKENEWHWNTIDEDRDVWHYKCTEAEKRVKELKTENEQLKKDVEYWKQVASQYSNELNVFEHCKKHKTECKDIYWSSDVE